MRWYVDISLIGSTAPLSRFCVEAAQWQTALQSVRATRGDLAPFGNFSIELRDDGYRAIDPVSRTRYEVQRAPDDAPLARGDAGLVEDPSEVTPAIVRPSAAPPADRTARPRPSSRAARAAERQAARGRAPAIPDDPVPRTATSDPPRANGSAAPAITKIPSAPPPPRPSAPPPGPPSSKRGLPFKVLSSREEEPTPASPLTYRELAIAVAAGTAVADAETLARAQYEVLRNSISAAPKGKFIQLAVFDHEFTGKPKSPPLIVLTFKDWRSPDPEIRRPSPPAVNPTPAATAPVSESEQVAASRAPTRLEPIVVPNEARPSRPTEPAPAPAPAPEPAPAPAVAPKQHIPDPTPSAIQRAAKDMLSDDEHTLVDVNAPPNTPPTASTPPAPEATPSSPPAAASIREAKTMRMPSVPSPPPSASSAPAQPTAPKVTLTPAPSSSPSSASIPSAPVSVPSTLVVRQARGPRRTGDDLITDLFEACCDLGFLGDPLEGAEFVLSLVLDALHCRLALVSFFDINAREFVVVRQGLAHGSGLQVPNVALTRASEKSAYVTKAMASHRALVLNGAGAKLVAADPRWQALGFSPRSLLCAPVESGGRYLGLIEVADSLDGAEFSESDGHALTYVGNQLAEFLSQRELVIDPERVTRPKLAQVSRRPSV